MPFYRWLTSLLRQQHRRNLSLLMSSADIQLVSELSPLICPQNTRCSTHTYHSRRQKLRSSRTAPVEQFTGYLATDF